MQRHCTASPSPCSSPLHSAAGSHADVIAARRVGKLILVESNELFRAALDLLIRGADVEVARLRLPAVGGDKGRGRRRRRDA